MRHPGILAAAWALTLAIAPAGAEEAQGERDALPPFLDLVVIDVGDEAARDASMAQLQRLEAQLQQLRARIDALGRESQPIQEATLDLLLAQARTEMALPPFTPPPMQAFADIQRVHLEALRHWGLDAMAPTPAWARSYAALRERERALHQRLSPLETCLRDLTALRQRLLVQLGVGQER